ncbi:MAG: hypothetical protein HY956_10015 [Deltaproteobacteria bacterium]|nr:hypothetical protein [Deltaproteobacteria bacterium]
MKKTLVSAIGALTLMLTVSAIAAASDMDLEKVLPADGRFRLVDDDSRSLLDRMTSLCIDNGGEAAYIIPRRQGRLTRLTEASLEEARLNAEGPDDYWIMSCDGGAKFLVEKESRAMNNGAEVASFHSNRGLLGVDYIKDGGAAAGAESAVDPAMTDEFLMEMAREVNAMGLDFVRARGGRRYLGERTGEKGLFCEGVVIKELEGAGVAKVHDFKVCDSRVVKTGEKSGSTALVARN